MDKKLKVLFLENINREAEKMFSPQDFEIEFLDHALSKEELIKKVADIDVLGIRSKTVIDKDVIAAAKNMKALGCFIIGLNKVDVKACSDAGICVFNAPYSSCRSVAELTIGLVVSLLRRLQERSSGVHAGEWQKIADGCFEARGKTLGIVGYGNIGSQVSVLAEAFGMNIIFYDIKDKLPIGSAKKASSFEELLGESDIVTLHTDENETSINMMNRRTIGLMRSGSYLINLARGSAVVVDDLARALKAGKLAGAALDTYPSEPSSNGPGFKSVMQGLPNVILTPHIGASTLEAQTDIAVTTSEKIYYFLKEGRTKGSVNFPEITPEPKNGSPRVLIAYRNSPEAGTRICNKLASCGLEPTSQYSRAKLGLGYMIADLAKQEKDLTGVGVRDAINLDNVIKISAI